MTRAPPRARRRRPRARRRLDDHAARRSSRSGGRQCAGARRSGERRDRPGAGIRRLGQRQRLWPRRRRRRRSRACSTASISTPAWRSISIFSPATRHVVRDFAALVKSRGIAPAAVDLRFSINPIGGFAASRPQPATLERARARLSPRWSASLPAPAFAGRSPSPTGASSTMPAARKRRSSPSRWRAPSPICARSKRGGMALDAARDAIYFRLSADADQFLTMAKFRAVRKLWARVEAACGLAPKPVMRHAPRPHGG